MALTTRKAVMAAGALFGFGIGVGAGGYMAYRNLRVPESLVDIASRLKDATAATNAFKETAAQPGAMTCDTDAYDTALDASGDMIRENHHFMRAMEMFMWEVEEKKRAADGREIAASLRLQADMGKLLDEAQPVIDRLYHTCPTTTEDEKSGDEGRQRD